MVDSSPAFTRASAAYERVMVPAVFAPCARDMIPAVGLAPGLRILDVACGTGVVARLVAPEVGPSGRVVAVDISEPMLAMARAQEVPPGAPIDWRRADAASLPFGDEDFDIVLCQHGLQYFPDRRAALREMKRVLVRSGRLGLSVFSDSAGYRLFEQTAAPFIGETAAALLQEPFALGSLHELSQLLTTAGFSDVELRTATYQARFASVDRFLDYQLSGRLANAAGDLTDERHAMLVEALRTAFEPYTGTDGLTFPMEAHVARAQK